MPPSTQKGQKPLVYVAPIVSSRATGDAPCDSHDRLDTSRGEAAWVSHMAANIVGTAIRQVICSCWIVSSDAPGSKPGSPTSRGPRRLPPRGRCHNHTSGFESRTSLESARDQGATPTFTKSEVPL